MEAELLNHLRLHFQTSPSDFRHNNIERGLPEAIFDTCITSAFRRKLKEHLSSGFSPITNAPEKEVSKMLFLRGIAQKSFFKKRIFYASG